MKNEELTSQTIKQVINTPGKTTVLVLSEKQEEKIYASLQDIEAGRMLDNKLLRKEVRSWLKNR